MDPVSSSIRWKRKAYLLALIFLISLAVLGWLIFRPEALDVDAAKVTRGDFTMEIRADGYFRSKDIRILSAFATGDIMERITVNAGDRVRKGQALTTLYWDRRLIVRSPVDGVITKVFRSSTGPVNRGDPLLEIMDPNQLEVVAELLTTDAVRVSPGNQVLVSGWGGPGLLRAVVTRVSRAGFVKPSALGVEEERTEVVADLSEAQPAVLKDIGSRFHNEVRIQISRINNTLKVPIGALIRHGEGWAVFQIMNERAVLTPVELGPRNNDEAVLESGPAEGAEVILYPGEDIRDKDRVRRGKAAGQTL
jgi:HlyD family secretion protein